MLGDICATDRAVILRDFCATSARVLVRIRGEGTNSGDSTAIGGAGGLDSPVNLAQSSSRSSNRWARGRATGRANTRAHSRDR